MSTRSLKQMINELDELIKNVANPEDYSADIEDVTLDELIEDELDLIIEN